MQTEQIHLFANGTQFMDWMANNCDRCALAGDGSEAGSSVCELFEAIHDAGASDGTVTPEIAKRLGYDDAALHYVWPCPERTSVMPWEYLHKNDLAALAAWNAGEPIRA